MEKQVPGGRKPSGRGREMRRRQMHSRARRDRSVSRREDRAGACGDHEAGGSHGETEAAGLIRALRTHLEPQGARPLTTLSPPPLPLQNCPPGTEQTQGNWRLPGKDADLWSSAADSCVASVTELL